MRHPKDTTPDNAPLEEIIATGGLSDIARWEYFESLDRAVDAIRERRKRVAEQAWPAGGPPNLGAVISDRPTWRDIDHLLEALDRKGDPPEVKD